MFRKLKACRIFLVVIACLLSVLSEAAKILVVIPTPSISHQVVFRPLYIELAKKGHNVTVITTDPAFPKGRTPANLTEIDFHDVSYGILHKNFLETPKGKKEHLIPQLEILLNSMIKTNKKQLESEIVQNILRHDEFDLLIIEAWCRSYLVYSHFIKAPVILMSSFGAFYSNYEIMGVPSHQILYPKMTTQKINNLTIFDKLNEIYNNYKVRNLMLELEEYETEALREVFGDDVPPLHKLEENVDMLFLNNFVTWEGNRPVTPSVVHIGGIHQHSKKDLPKDLKEYLDSSKNGVIYVSFGTNVSPSMLPEESIQVLIKTFSELPYNVLWKWDQDILNGCPSNVKLSKWFPQSDLLRHPNVKLFITQGGLQSTDEAILSAVPLVGIPMLGDQWHNVERYVQHGIGEYIELNDLSVNKFKNVIETVINNTKYRSNIERFRSILYDQPQTPLERAVWWTEYVIRHKGAKHLKGPAAHVTWWEFLEMDLVLVVSSFALALICLLIFVLKYVINSVVFVKSDKIKSY